MAMREGALRSCAAVLAAIWTLGAAPERPALRSEETAADAIAARHRIQLPDGSQIMLRREYRVIFRAPMRWAEGMLLERVYVAGREGGARDRA